MQQRYTLLELIVVVAILAMVLTLAAGRMGSGSSSLRLQAEADELASFLSSARSIAIRQGANAQVLLEGRVLSVELAAKTGANAASDMEKDSKPGACHKIPETIEIKVKPDESGGRVKLFTFFPDGRGSGSPISLSLKVCSFDVSVSPLTGIISVKETAE